MPLFGDQKKEIARLKADIAKQREALGDRSTALSPVAEKIDFTGSIYSTIRPALPLLKPVAEAVLKRVSKKNRKTRLFWLVLPAGIGILACFGYQYASRKRSQANDGGPDS